MKFKKLSHCVYKCEYHIVLVTKYRRKILNEGISAYLRTKIEETRKYYPEVEYEEVKGEMDHVHMLVSIPPTRSVGSVVRIIKSNTGKKIREKFPKLREVYWGSGGIWSDGYFVSTVGVNEATIREYIQKQGEEDSGQAKLELG